MNARSSKTQITHNWPYRKQWPAKGNGRVQKSIKRALVGGGTITTADAAAIAYCRKLLLHGRKLVPDDYRVVRRALSLIATPIGRGGGRGRPTVWKWRER